MYQITPKLYNDVAQRLCDAIDGENYYSGSITFSTDEIDYRLTLSVIIYRNCDSYLDADELNSIADLVPVWWEFHSYDTTGEIINDFCFKELKAYII